jgi:hypothetical protein
MLETFRRKEHSLRLGLHFLCGPCVQGNFVHCLVPLFEPALTTIQYALSHVTEHSLSYVGSLEEFSNSLLARSLELLPNFWNRHQLASTHIFQDVFIAAPGLIGVYAGDDTPGDLVDAMTKAVFSTLSPSNVKRAK